MLTDFFNQIKIKYVDWPVILYPLLAVILVTFLVIWVFGTLIGQIVLIVLSLFVVLIALTHFYRRMQRDLRNQQQKQQAYLMLLQLLDIETPLPYMTDWAATPELSLVITDIITREKPEFVLELGSGVSTVVAALSLQKNRSGRVLALDHDEAFAEKTGVQIQKHNLQRYADIRFSPLHKIQLKKGTWSWYNLSNDSLEQPIDLLIVDGPPLETENHSRYPALPVLYSKLSQHATVIVHDTHRKVESEIVSFWMGEFPDFSRNDIDSEKGITILTKKSGAANAPAVPSSEDV